MLPIQLIRDELLRTLTKTNRAIVTADPGSGKSTQLPLFFLDKPGKTLVAQPRRIAACSLAEFVSQQLGEKTGHRVGYRVRFDRKISDATQIEFVTDGMLVRQLQSDPELHNIHTVVLDEFHERSLHLDLALAFLLEIQTAYRPDLRIIIMSATLDVRQLCHWFAAEHFHASGTVYANEILHVEHPIERPNLPLATSKHILKLTRDPASRNILAFLPGRREIEATKRALEGKTNLTVSVLHGQLSLAAQSKVLNNPEQQIVLSTNIAETSLTIPNVNRVVDSGWQRAARFVESWASTALFTSRITQFSAEQRAGRANRTSNGVVHRLWTKYEQMQIAQEDLPEIRTANLERFYLECLSWGCPPTELNWLTPPPPKSLFNATTLLTTIGAVGADGRMTDQAKTWHTTALSPRANAVLAAAVKLPLEDRIRVAFLLPVLDGERLPTDRHRSLRERFEGLSTRHNYTKVIETIGRRLNLPLRLTPPTPILSEVTLGAILAGFPERLGARRSEHSNLFLMASGTGARIPADLQLNGAEFVLALSVGGPKASELTIFDGVAVERSQIPFTHEDALFFSEAEQKVVCRNRHAFRALVLNERPRPLPNQPKDIAQCLAQAASQKPLKAFSTSTALEMLCRRVEHANAVQISPVLPTPFDGMDATEHWKAICTLCTGLSSFAQLARIDLVSFYLDSLSYELKQTLERLSPQTLALSNGQKLKVDYSKAHGPTLSTRFEWLFGIEETPTLHGQPLMLELLAPNLRPIQMTRDLASFWVNGYPEVRRTLRGRYPKHPWPDDPLSTNPGVGRRRKK